VEEKQEGDSDENEEDLGALCYSKGVCCLGMMTGDWRDGD
jgi:hypothetical protein